MLQYENYFSQLPEEWRTHLRPTERRLTGFTRHNIWPLGIVQLPFSLYDHDVIKKKTVLIEFVVVRHPTEHSIILGKTALLRFKAIAETHMNHQCYQVMEATEITRGEKQNREDMPKEKK